MNTFLEKITLKSFKDFKNTQKQINSSLIEIEEGLKDFSGGNKKFGIKGLFYGIGSEYGEGDKEKFKTLKESIKKENQKENSEKDFLKTRKNEFIEGIMQKIGTNCNDNKLIKKECENRNGYTIEMYKNQADFYKKIKKFYQGIIKISQSNFSFIFIPIITKKISNTIEYENIDHLYTLEYFFKIHFCKNYEEYLLIHNFFRQIELKNFKFLGWGILAIIFSIFLPIYFIITSIFFLIISFFDNFWKKINFPYRTVCIILLFISLIYDIQTNGNYFYTKNMNDKKIFLENKGKELANIFFDLENLKKQ